MKITVKRSRTVKPIKETASGSLWLSSLDLLHPNTPFHSRFVLFYRPDSSADFIDAEALAAALSRALVDFYPLAGRLRKDADGRLEINCNGLGAVFMEAECDGTVADLGGFSPRPDVALAPAVDYSDGISSFPLSLIQLTRFRCGGISLGFSMETHAVNVSSFFKFVQRWCEISRGGATAAAVSTPFLDRRILAPCNPPRPQFTHIEHQPLPSLETPLHHSATTTSFRTFSLTRHHINSLKQNCESSHTTYEVVAGHVWRCATAARRLPENQETRLQFPVDGRQKLRPPLPAEYFGNHNFNTVAAASCGELTSNPLRFAAGKVREAKARMDDEYMRSAIDYWELQLRRSSGGASIPLENRVKCPNLGMTSWMWVPSTEMDFGWGKPIYGGPAVAPPEGKSFLFADPENKGNLLLAITLYEQHMEIFGKLLYGDECSLLMSKI